jgi:DNA helicase II / ATP-dependent DNA helicase PcrA
MIDFDAAPGGKKIDEKNIGVTLDRFNLETPVNELPDYLQRLNAPQREAALTTEGPLMVLAGAGSGKTSMVTARIAYLIGYCGAAPHQILAMTFTNKAAGEMRERVNRSLDQVGVRRSQSYFSQPEIGTFHSVCVRILRRELPYTPFTKPFVIYDDSDQLVLIKSIMDRLNIDKKAFNPKSFQYAINLAKCDAIEPGDTEVSPLNPFDRHKERVYEAYQRELFANNALDFGEIITLTYRLLRDNPLVREKYQNLYRYIHVDEYQDTNRAQYLLLSTLASKRAGGHGNICVVGDEDQSIYKWRGADIRNILDFDKDFPGAAIVKLEQNYRSTKTIIQAASEVIGHNTTRKEKVLWTENEEGEPLLHYHLPDERAEAELVVSEIRRISTETGRALDEFSIFYRTHAQSRQFEDVLRRHSLSYKIVGGLKFYDRKEIKDILAYFRVLMNPTDSVSVKRIINVPARAIGKTTLNRLDQILFEEELGQNPDQSGTPLNYWSLLEKVARGETPIPARTAGKIAEFVSMMQRLMDKREGFLVSDLYHEILDETKYVMSLKAENTIEAQARVENLEEFDTLLQEFEEDVLGKLSPEEQEKIKPLLLEQFLERVTLAAEVTQEDQERSVRLMTLHASKGLEFPFVFLVGLEEGLFPSIRQWEDTPPEEIEEERRLCYVGMTRAREKLYLSHVSVRRLWGSVSYQKPARFLSEMPSANLKFIDLVRQQRATVSPSGLRSHSNYFSQESGWQDESEWIGKRIRHPQYGAGRILAAEGATGQEKLTIEFGYQVRKKFLLRFVKDFLE